MAYDDAQFLGRLASWDASESSLLLRTDGVSKCIHQGHQDSLPIATWQRKAYPSNWMILNDSISIEFRIEFACVFCNVYQSHQEELVQYSIFFLVCKPKERQTHQVKKRPQPADMGPCVAISNPFTSIPSVQRVCRSAGLYRERCGRAESKARLASEE